jgi:hypothetical protein
MSLRLVCLGILTSPPRRVVLELHCDGDHGLFPADPGHFDLGGFVANYSAAMNAGWLDRYDSMLCPDCSGKRARRGEHDPHPERADA